MISAVSNTSDRRGTILIFFLAAMAIIGVYVTALTRAQSDQMSGASAGELRLVAEATALSGIEIMVTIAENTTENGPQFLSARERELTTGTPYSMSRLFGLPTGLSGTYCLPPIEYPPLKDIALTVVPTNQPPTIADTDILLLNNKNTVNLPASNYYFVLGATASPPLPATPDFNGPAILPAAGYQPPQTDNTNYSAAKGCDKSGSSNWRIAALEPKHCNDPIGWYGDENQSGTYLPVTADRFTGHGGYAGWTGRTKMTPPSFVVGRDFTVGGAASYRCFLYAWYVHSPAGLAAPDRLAYYMTSGRVRTVLRPSGAPISLGTEVAVSNTQLR